MGAIGLETSLLYPRNHVEMGPLVMLGLGDTGSTMVGTKVGNRIILFFLVGNCSGNG